MNSRALALPLGCLVLVAWLAGCASNPSAPVEDLSVGAKSGASTAGQESASRHEQTVAAGVYIVARGDTLYAIAFNRGLDFRDLAAWNQIASPYRIYTGQQLRLSAPGGIGAGPTAGIGVTAATPDNAVAAASTPLPPVAQNPHVENATPRQSAAPATPEAVKAAPVPPPPVVPAPAAQPEVKPSPAPAVVTPPAVADSVAQLSAGGVTWRWPGDGKVVGTYVTGDQTRQGIDIAGKEGDPVRAAADGDVVYSGNGLLGYGELIIVKHNANFLSAYGHNRKRIVQEGDKVKAGQLIAEMGSSAGSREELHFEIRRNGKPVNPLDYLPVR
jgi:lipoprotein NlpD